MSEHPLLSEEEKKQTTLQAYCAVGEEMWFYYILRQILCTILTQPLPIKKTPKNLWVDYKAQLYATLPSPPPRVQPTAWRFIPWRVICPFTMGRCCGWVTWVGRGKVERLWWSKEGRGHPMRRRLSLSRLKLEHWKLRYIWEMVFCANLHMFTSLYWTDNVSHLPNKKKQQLTPCSSVRFYIHIPSIFTVVYKRDGGSLVPRPCSKN